MKRLLIIDDEPGHRLMIRAVMEDLGWEVDEAGTGEAGLELSENRPPTVVLLDVRMPGMGGEATLREMIRRHPEVPVVMLTAHGTVNSAVEAMKQGAFDYLTKPSDNEELAAVLEKAYTYGKLLAENKSLKRRLQGDDDRRLVGSSPAMRKVLELIEQAGPSEATVLITGESGTGKELVAEALHAASHRAGEALIKVNCAALPGSLLESELFGYVKGAFTGAAKDKPGRFQLAHGGALFLDEVGEIPLELQAKLLRVLQERTVEPLGTVRSVPVDVRILAATHRDLRQAVDERAFREDLYYRLNVLELRIPPLRERLDDLPALVGHLLHKLSRKNRRKVERLSPEFLDALSRYAWPGNVRELENVLERALILSPGGVIGPESLPPNFLQVEKKKAPVEVDEGESQTFVSLEEAEKSALIRALEMHAGHREKTAEALGMSRRALQYKLRKYGLTRR